MNKREKFLAMAVGGLIGVVGLFMVFSWVGDAFRARRQTIEALKSQIEDEELAIARARRASERRAAFEERSLPPDPALARSLYQKWLLETVARVKLDNVQVHAVGGRQVGKVYFQHTFTIGGRANLAQVVELLHAIYEVDYLHRVRQLRLKPIQDSKDLDISLALESVSILTAPVRRELPPPTGERLAGRTLEEFQEPILNRNPFGPANKPPNLAAGGSTRATKGRSFSLALKADDPDKLDKLTYELEKGPDDLRLDPQSGELRWTPKETGKFEVVVAVVDDGLPKRRVSKTIELTVADPPPPPPVRETRPTPPAPKPPEFDHAEHTFVTAILEVDGEPEVWLTVRTTGQTIKLREGEPLKLGSINGEVSRIFGRDFEILTRDSRLLYTVGDQLTQPVKLPGDGI